MSIFHFTHSPSSRVLFTELKVTFLSSHKNPFLLDDKSRFDSNQFEKGNFFYIPHSSHAEFKTMNQLSVDSSSCVTRPKSTVHTLSIILFHS